MSNMNRTTNIIAYFCIALFMAGCTDIFDSIFGREPPTCSSPEAQSLLKNIIAQNVYSTDTSVSLFISSINGDPLDDVLKAKQDLLDSEISTQMIVSDGYDKSSKKRNCSCRASFKNGSPLDISYSIQMEDGKNGSFVVSATRNNPSQFSSHTHQQAAGDLLALLYSEKIQAKRDALQAEKMEKEKAVEQRLSSEYETSKRNAIAVFNESPPEVKSALPEAKTLIETNFASLCQNDKENILALLRCQRLEADNLVTTIQRTAMDLITE